jgi:hypothetical protein
MELVSYLGIVPSEIKLEIMKYIPFKDLLVLCQTNRQFLALCRDNNLWRERLKIWYPNTHINGVNARERYYQLEGIRFVPVIYDFNVNMSDSVLDRDTIFIHPTDNIKELYDRIIKMLPSDVDRSRVNILLLNMNGDTISHYRPGAGSQINMMVNRYLEMTNVTDLLRGQYIPYNDIYEIVVRIR